MLRFVFAAIALVYLCGTSQAGAYQQVVCDNEPDPALCTTIENWYISAKDNRNSGCCGLGDAYWTDQIDRVTKEGLYVTVTDPRSCKKFSYDDEGDVVEDPSEPACITKPDMDGKQLWVPNDKIDRKGQGNPTGHTITFINAHGSVIYDPDGKEFPSVYCFFPSGGF